MARLRLLLAMALSITFTHPVKGGDFQGLGGLLESSWSYANGLSADGSVVVGYTQSPLGNQAFRWTHDGGIVGLGDLAGGRFESTALGVSADGSVVVGWGVSRPGFDEREAFRWTTEEGLVAMGDFAGGGSSSEACDVSDDGSIIIGFGSSTLGQEAFRWTSEEGMVGLGDDPGGTFSSDARAVSGDGEVVTGIASFAGEGSIQGGYRWTRDTGFVSLTDPPVYLYLYDVSFDGSTIIGSDGSSSNAAFRWTADEGLKYLGYPPDPHGRRRSDAYGVSADGSIVVGAMTTSTDRVAFIWNEQAQQVRSLQDVLIANGIDLAGWKLTAATAISADGKTVVGNGLNPANQQEAWIAVIPEPSSCYLATICAIVLVVFAHRAVGITALRASI